MGPGRQGTRGRAGVRLSGDVRAVSWAAAWGVRTGRPSAERGSGLLAAGRRARAVDSLRGGARC